MKNLMIVLMLVCCMTLMAEWQKVNSIKSEYTIQYPSDWQVANAYSKEPGWLETILEQTVLWDSTGARITIDMWKCNSQLPLSEWMAMMEEFIQVEKMVAEKTMATEQKVPALAYYFKSKGIQAYNSHQVFFKYEDKVFRASYLERDFGAALDIFWHIVRTMAFAGDAPVMGELSDEHKTASRQYSCGGQNDDCQCKADNPYPCCENGGGASGNCTWWAWEKACCVWGIGLPSPWRHAKYWAGDLSAHGYRVSSTPSVNTIACRNVGDYGHVAWVIAVNGSQVKVSEMNCCGGCNHGVREKWYDASYYTGGYISRP